MLCRRLLSFTSTQRLWCKTWQVRREGMCALVVHGSRKIHKSPVQWDLMEFFDDPKNWGAQEVKTGRSWKKEELRIKSNSDLHKLWFVLLKEYNMLLTMEHASRVECELFPSPERIDKVQESMENLEEVVRERNRAYYMLETGETGERPKERRIGPLGLEEEHKMSEYLIPKEDNQEWQELHFEGKGSAVNMFVKRYKNMQSKEKLRELRRQKGHVEKLLKRFPHLDKNLLKEKYPELDIDKIMWGIA